MGYGRLSNEVEWAEARWRRMVDVQVVVTHEVDDVDHWFNSPKRAEFFERHGMSVTAFRDPEGGGHLTAVLIEAPDMATLEAALQSDEAQQAMQHDGVRPDTVQMFVAG